MIVDRDKKHSKRKTRKMLQILKQFAGCFVFIERQPLISDFVKCIIGGSRLTYLERIQRIVFIHHVIFNRAFINLSANKHI